MQKIKVYKVNPTCRESQLVLSTCLIASLLTSSPTFDNATSIFGEEKNPLPTSSAFATIDLLLAFEKELRKRWLAGAGNNFCTNMLHSRHLSFKAENCLKIVKIPPRHVALHLDHLLHGVLGKENDQGEASDPAGFP